jgi:S1-C subfamily serine protease
VVEDGPGVKGGVRVGDVILAVAGKPVKDFSDLVEIVEKTPIGKPVQVDVWRNKGKMTLFVTVGERP